MQSIFLLDAVIPVGTKAQHLQTCSEPVSLKEKHFIMDITSHNRTPATIGVLVPG